MNSSKLPSNWKGLLRSPQQLLVHALRALRDLDLRAATPAQALGGGRLLDGGASTLDAKRSRHKGAWPGTLGTARPGMRRQAIGLLICPTAAVHCASWHTDKTANAPSNACGKFKRTVESGRHHKAPLRAMEEGLVALE
jgi:hypothetical protein